MTDRDIVERLRILAEEWSLRSYTVTHALHESADAIDALRAEVAQVGKYADALNARCIEDTAEIGRLRAEVARLTAEAQAAAAATRQVERSMLATLAAERERAERAEAERDALLSALAQCVESLRGYRREHGDDQACDAEADAVRLLDAARAREAER
jgi:hypothetical protein